MAILGTWRQWLQATLVTVCALAYSLTETSPIPAAIGELSYIGLVLLGVQSRQRFVSYLLALFASLLIVAAHLIKVPEISLASMASAHLALIPSVWLIAYFVQRVRNVEHSMQHSTGHLKAIWDTVVDGMILIDTRGIVQTVNPAAEKLFGYKSEEMIGKNVKMLMPEQYSSKHDGYLSSYMKSGKAQIIGTGRKVEGMKKNGETFPLYLAVSEVKVGNELFFTGIVRDLTLEVRNEQRMLSAKDEAERANEAKSLFLSSMSHELRTPMNAILGFAQLLELEDRENPLADNQQEAVRQIIRGGDHLLTLINDVLDLSKIESGTITVSIESVSALEILDDSRDMVSTMAEKYGVELNIVEPGHGDMWVTADRLRLRQIVLNLLTNAIKYNRREGSVTVSCDKVEGGRVRISVRDTGPGIPDDRRESIFEPFNRLGYETTGVEGTGIGLAISARLAGLMDATIDFTSSSTGSEFWIDLPIAQPMQEGMSGQSRLPDALSDSNEAKLLYVEDNPSNIALMEHMMRSIGGVSLESTPTAELGMELAQSRPFDLILMDLNLPGMSGLEAFKWLSEDPKTSAIPVIAITADATTQTRRKVEQLGFKAYISKPIDVSNTLTTIRKHIDEQMETRNNAVRH